MMASTRETSCREQTRGPGRMKLGREDDEESCTSAVISWYEKRANVMQQRMRYQTPVGSVLSAQIHTQSVVVHTALDCHLQPTRLSCLSASSSTGQGRPGEGQIRVARHANEL